MREAMTGSLLGFSPRYLTSREWEVARGAVTRVVLDARPVDRTQARAFAARLCHLLGGLPTAEWDRKVAPDLAALLTDPRIQRATSSDVLPTATSGTRRVYRTHLRRLARAARGEEREVIRPAARASTASATFWSATAHSGSTCALFAAYGRLRGTVHTDCWAGIANDLAMNLHSLVGDVIVPAPTAGVGDDGTVAAVLAAAVALRSVTASLSGATPTMPKSMDTPNSQCSRRTSRAAAVRAAREAIRAGASPTSTAASLPVQFERMLSEWTPQGMSSQNYAPIKSAVSAAVRAYSPKAAADLRNVRSIVAAFAIWVHGRPGRGRAAELDARELTADGLIEEYVAGPLGGAPRSSRATTRGKLRRVVRGLAPDRAPERIAYQAVQTPYTAVDCARFVTLARQQPTTALRRALSAMVALGLGAGLGARDLGTIAPIHIVRVDLPDGSSAVAVQVPGPAPLGRTVVVRQEYEALLREALNLHAKARRGHRTPLCGVKADSRNRVNRIAADAATATGVGIDISASRLRATWLVACMSASVPLSALLHASGLRTPRTFADLLPYCPPADPNAVAQILRAVSPRTDIA